MITGASGGIGEALAHVFYRAGCRLVLAARREHELERVCHELLDLRLTGIETYRPEIVPLDLGDVKTLPAKASKILSKFGHVDILINNGGISVRTDILSAKNEVDVRVMTVNYLGTVALTKCEFSFIYICVNVNVIIDNTQNRNDMYKCHKNRYLLLNMINNVNNGKTTNDCLLFGIQNNIVVWPSLLFISVVYFKRFFYRFCVECFVSFLSIKVSYV